MSLSLLQNRIKATLTILSRCCFPPFVCGLQYKIHMRHHLHNFPPRLVCECRDFLLRTALTPLDPSRPCSNFYGKPGMVAKVYGKDCPTLWELMDPRKSTYFTLAHEGPLYLFMGIIIVIARFGFSVSWSHVCCLCACSPP